MTTQNTGTPAGADQPMPADQPARGGQPQRAPADQQVPAAQPLPDPAVTGAASSAERAPGAAEASAPPPPVHHKVRRTRAGGVWVTLAIAAVILVLLLVFILGNLKQADVSLFGAHADLPLGVALLLAAVAGAIIVIIPGTGRIVQLRRIAHRHRHADAQQTDGPPPH
jgi:uncharacterized integral membrane protein